MEGSIVFSVFNAKYIHASPAPWCLKAGIKAYAPHLFSRVQIVEATINQPLSEVLQRLLASSPAVLGFSCYLWNINQTLTLCRTIKQILPKVIIVLGGPEVSYCASEVLQQHEAVDYILSGEGEESVPAFLTALFSSDTPNHLPQEAQEGIEGLCGRREDGTIYVRPPCVLSAAVPSPLTAGYADALKGRIAYLETSRGCPYSCAFCLSGRCGTPRWFCQREAETDLLLLANSGTRTVKLVDRTFNANVAHANGILQCILSKYGKEIPTGVCFHLELAGDILQESTLSLLEQMPSGAVQLEIGMQSFCEESLNAVHRATNLDRLEATIRRLVSMGNLHIHIDLIAGLPCENLARFAESVNKGYALGAHCLQLGFLKLLHGSAMRSEPENYPCTFNENPPYEVLSTPWLSPEDLALLHDLEDALDRVYNSGRFLLTAAYVLRVSGLSPFDFYAALGLASRHAGIQAQVSLDDYTAFLQEYVCSLPGVNPEALRDVLVRDRLASNASGRLPLCLYREDAQLAKAVKRLVSNQATAPKPGVRRGVALLYDAKTLCCADYLPWEQNPVTGRWPLKEFSLATLLS